MIGREIAEPGNTSPHKLKPNDFAWCSKRATAWRGKASETAMLIGCKGPEDAAAALGPRWAFYLSQTWQGWTGDDLQPFLIADHWQKRKMTNDLAQISKRRMPGWIVESERSMVEFCRDDEWLPGYRGIVYRVPNPKTPVHDPEGEKVYIEEHGGERLLGTFDECWKFYLDTEKARLEKIAEENLELN